MFLLSRLLKSVLEMLEDIEGAGFEDGGTLEQAHISMFLKKNKNISFDDFITSLVPTVREGIRKKIRNYLGIFPKCRTPPHPPLLGTPRPKKKIWFILRFRP